MKRLLSIILLILIICTYSCAHAEEYEIDFLSIDELYVLKDRIDTRIQELETIEASITETDVTSEVIDKDIPIYDANGLSIYFEDWEYSDGLNGNDPYILINVRVINDSDYEYSMMYFNGESYVNDYEAKVLSKEKVAAHKKTIHGICLQNLSKIDINSIYDIKSVECNFHITPLGIESDWYPVSVRFDNIHAYPMHEN